MPSTSFRSLLPTIPASAWVAPTAWVIGDVSVGEQVSVYFGAVLRGDIEPIRVGDRTNIQEGALLHTSVGRSVCRVGDDVTIGHQAIVHGCSVGSRCIIGMGAILLDDAVVEDDCIIGAHALVTSRTVIPRGSLVMGSPARVVRALTEGEIQSLVDSAKGYVDRLEGIREAMHVKPDKGVF